MRRREQDIERLMETVAPQEGARFVCLQKTNGGHLRAIVLKGGENFKFFASSTSTNWEGDKNLLAIREKAAAECRVTENTESLPDCLAREIEINQDEWIRLGDAALAALQRYLAKRTPTKEESD